MKQVWKHLISSFYIKPTGCQHSLHYATGHPVHINWTRICRQTLKLKQLYSRIKHFKKYKSQMKLWFSKRGYLKKFMGNGMEKFTLVYNKNKCVEYKEKRAPFVVTYHTSLSNFKKIVDAISKNWLMIMVVFNT